MTHERRHTLIRTMASLTGDIAIALLFSSVCIWIINFAALGIFLSFLLWLIAALVCLAASQYLIHPTVQFLLSDRKLEEVLRTTHGLYGVFVDNGLSVGRRVWERWRGPDASPGWRNI